jgi:peptidoglycan/LPS O-acetylase OafA/YrhL
VDVFFVLSGYLITSVLVASAEQPEHGHFTYREYLSNFYSHRARRILPAAAVTLAATDLAAVSLLNVYRAHQVLVDGIWATFFAANIHFANVGTNYFALGQPPSPIQHFWSLAVEEQFYVVWPLLIAVILIGAGLSASRRSRDPAHILPRSYRALTVTVVVIIGASLTYCIYYTNHNTAAAYFSTPARAWELGLGALLSLHARRAGRLPSVSQAILGWGGIAAITVASVLFTSGTRFPGVAALLPTVGAAAVIAAGINKSQGRLALSRVLALRPLRYIGDRSYTFYLWHWPVLILAMEHTGHSLSLTTNLLLLAGAFLLSIFTYRAFENPLRRNPKLNARLALALWPAAICGVLFVTGLHWEDLQNDINLTAVAPAPPPALAASVQVFAAQTGPKADTEVVPISPAAVIASAAAVTRDALIPSTLTPPVLTITPKDSYGAPGNCGVATGLQVRIGECNLGQAGAKRSIVMLGDSIAQMWLPDVEAYANAHGYAVYPVIHTGCPPEEWATGPDVNPVCVAWYNAAVRRVEAIHPAILIAGVFYNADDVTLTDVAPLLADLGTFLSTARRSTNHLVVLGNAPDEPEEPVDCLLRAGATMKKCSWTETSNQVGVNTSVASIARSYGGFIDTTPWFCYRLECPMVIGDSVVRVDLDHITITYAQQLSQLFGGALARLLSSGGAKPRSG